MDFTRYAERAAELVNTPIESPGDLVQFLLSPRSLGYPDGCDEDTVAGRTWLIDQVEPSDATELSALRADLRRVFDAAADGDDPTAVATINGLLSSHPITPRIAGTDSMTWHLHATDRDSSVADLLAAEALMGLANLVCDLGSERLGRCDAHRCDDVYVDTSPNRSRRYCSERCASRSNVAAYRARKKAEAAQATAEV